MKLIKVAIMVLLSLVLFVGCSNDTSEEITKYEQYENTEYGLTIDYPDNWKVQEDVMGSVVVFLSPLDKNDQFSENVNIFIEDISEYDINLDQYTELSISNIKEMIEGVTILTNEDSKLSGYNAKTFTYTGTQNEMELKWKQTYALSDGKVYIATYTAGNDTYDKYVKNFDDIVKTLIIE